MNRLSFLPFLTLVPLAASAQVVYTENFNDGAAAGRWSFNSSVANDPINDGKNSDADFAFDYSTVGIPAAPRSNGTTIGLKVQANIVGTPSPVFSGMSASPLGQSFSGDYTLSFDSWLNFQGPATSATAFGAGGSGTTQAMLAGIGSAATTAQFPGGTFNGVGFAGTVDGGATQDFRAYNGSGAQLAPTPGVFAAGSTTAPDSRNSSDPYYASFTGSVPAAQTTYANTLGFTNQTGATDPGDLGFAWRRWDITKIGTTVTWSIDGKLIATVTGANPAGNDIFLGFFDTNGTPSTDAYSKQLLFGLVDNVSVTQAVPEPSAFAALGLGALAFVRRRRK